jgi:hypothetical protein
MVYIISDNPSTLQYSPPKIRGGARGGVAMQTTLIVSTFLDAGYCSQLIWN